MLEETAPRTITSYLSATKTRGYFQVTSLHFLAATEEDPFFSEKYEAFVPSNAFLPNLLAAPFPSGHFIPTFAHSFTPLSRMESGDAIGSNMGYSSCSPRVLFTLSDFT